MFVPQNDKDQKNIEKLHKLTDEKILEYLYALEEGQNPLNQTLETMSPSTRSLFLVIKS